MRDKAQRGVAAATVKELPGVWVRVWRKGIGREMRDQNGAMPAEIDRRTGEINTDRKCNDGCVVDQRQGEVVGGKGYRGQTEVGGDRSKKDERG